MFLNKVKLDKHREQENYSYFFAFLLCMILPIHVDYLPPLMILWVLARIIENYNKSCTLQKIRKDYLLLFILFVSYYLWQAVGLIYSQDTRMGLLNLFSRLSLLMFPIVLILPGDSIKRNIKKLIIVFAISTSLYLISCFGYAFYRSINISDGILIFNPHPEDFWLNYFYGSELMVGQHPSYFAMYALMATFISFEMMFDFNLKPRDRILWFFAGLFLLISQNFISSRAGIIISTFLVPFYLFLKMRRIKKFKYSWIGIILILIILIPVILKNQRMDYFFGRILNTPANYERKEDPRFKIWKASLNVVQKNLLVGVGVGDVRNELIIEYRRMGEEKMAEEGFNAHNQFLEVLIENGMIGLILFLALFFIMVHISLSDYNLLYGIFIIMVLLFFMFETVLYRLAGVTFFSFFSFLLLYAKSYIKMNHYNFK